MKQQRHGESFKSIANVCEDFIALKKRFCNTFPYSEYQKLLLKLTENDDTELLKRKMYSKFRNALKTKA